MQTDSDEEPPQADTDTPRHQTDDDCAELDEVFRRRRRELEELFAS